MPDLADLYPGYASHWIDTSIGKISPASAATGRRCSCCTATRRAMSCGIAWRRNLAKHFTLVLADLPGYGWSAVPEAAADHSPYTKRAMAAGWSR